MRTRGLLVVAGRGVAARVTLGRGSHGIHGFRTVEVLRGRGDALVELPFVPFFTVITT